MLSDLLSTEAHCASPNTDPDAPAGDTLASVAYGLYDHLDSHDPFGPLDPFAARSANGTHNVLTALKQQGDDLDSYACLQELCQRYASQFNIKICFQGDTAYATPNSIVLPQITQCSPEQLHLNAGYLAHEAGHICFSDFSLYEQLHQAAKLHLNLLSSSSSMFTTVINPTTHEKEISLQPIAVFNGNLVSLTLINILEDCRVDYLMCQHHPEVFPYLQFLNKTLYYRHLQMVPFLYRYHKLQLLFSYLMFFGHDLLLHYQWSDSLRDIYARELSTLMDLNTLRQITKYMGRLTLCKSTKDVLSLSNLLEKLLQDSHSFVPDLQRFALHHQLTSSIDLKHCAELAKYYGQGFNVPVLNPRPREQQVQSYEHLQKLVAAHRPVLAQPAKVATATAAVSVATPAASAATPATAANAAVTDTSATTATSATTDNTDAASTSVANTDAATLKPNTSALALPSLAEDSHTPWPQLLLRARLNPYLFTDRLQNFDFSDIPAELHADGIDLSLRQYSNFQQHQCWLSSPNFPLTTIWHNDLQRREAILREQYLLENVPTNILPSLDPHAYCRDANGAVQPCDYTILWLCALACYQQSCAAFSHQVKKQLKAPHAKLSQYLLQEQPREVSCQISSQEIKAIELSSLIGPLAGINGAQLSSILELCRDPSVLPPALQQSLEGLVRNWRNIPAAKLVVDEQHKQTCMTHLAQNLQAVPTYAALIHNIYQWQRRCYEELDTNRRDPLQDISYDMALRSMSQQPQLILTHLCAATALATAKNSETDTLNANLSLQQTYAQASTPWQNIVNPLAATSPLNMALDPQMTANCLPAATAYVSPAVNAQYASAFPHLFAGLAENTPLTLSGSLMSLDSLTNRSTVATLTELTVQATNATTNTTTPVFPNTATANTAYGSSSFTNGSPSAHSTMATATILDPSTAIALDNALDTAVDTSSETNITAWVQQVKSSLSTYQAAITPLMRYYSKQQQIKLQTPNIKSTLPKPAHASATVYTRNTLAHTYAHSATATAATTDAAATITTSATTAINSNASSLFLPPLMTAAHTAMHIVVDLSLPQLSSNTIANAAVTTNAVTCAAANMATNSTTATTANTNANPNAQAPSALMPLAALGNSFALAQALLNRNMDGLCTLISYTRPEQDALDHGLHQPHAFAPQGNAYALNRSNSDADSALITVLPPHHDIEPHAADLNQAPHKPCALHSALWQALYKLLPCNAPRQIMVLITTQEPPAYKTTPSLSELLAELAIDFYTIGIGLGPHSAWSRLCNHYYALKSEQQIPLLLKLLNNKLWRTGSALATMEPLKRMAAKINTPAATIAMPPAPTVTSNERPATATTAVTKAATTAAAVVAATLPPMPSSPMPSPCHGVCHEGQSA